MTVEATMGSLNLTISITRTYNKIIPHSDGRSTLSSRAIIMQTKVQAEQYRKEVAGVKVSILMLH